MDATANFSLRFARASESKVETPDWFSEQKADRFYRLLLAEISSAQKAGTEVSREQFEEIWDFVFNSDQSFSPPAISEHRLSRQHLPLSRRSPHPDTPAMQIPL
jgi:hypothetical protein